MKKLPILSAVVFAALSIALLPSCGIIIKKGPEKALDPAKIQEAIAEYRNQELELIRETILDSESADQFIQLLGERDRLFDKFSEDIEKYRIQMSDLNKDYNSDRQSFDTLMDRFNQRRMAGQLEVIELIAAMKAETTPEEWKVIAKFQSKRLDPRRLTYDQTAAGG